MFLEEFFLPQCCLLCCWKVVKSKLYKMKMNGMKNNKTFKNVF